MNNNFIVFSGTATRYLTEKICASLGTQMGNINVTRFSDGEFSVCYEESIRGRDVFLVQSTFPNSDNLMELLLMIDAAKRASAKTVNAVIPYFGWARQDRKTNIVSPSAPNSSQICSASLVSTDSSQWTCTPTRSRDSSTSPSTISTGHPSSSHM